WASGRSRCSSGCGALPGEARAQEGERFIGGKLGTAAVTAMTVLEPSGVEPALRDHQTVWDTEELRVRELDPRPRIAVVVEHLDAGGAQLGIQAVADFADTGGLLQVERHQHELERRNRLGPDDAALIVILLDGGCHDARYTDAITAHVERDLPSGLIEHHSLHGRAVLAAELEDVANLDAAGNLQPSAPGGAGITFDHLTEVRAEHATNVPLPVYPGQVHVLLVRTAHEVGERQRAVIGIHAALEAHETDIAGLGAS